MSGKHPDTTPRSTDMSPKWATKAQEEFLESRYGDYLKLKNRGNRTVFRDFWETVKTEWMALFGWEAEDDAQVKGAQILEKVSKFVIMRDNKRLTMTI